MDEYDDGPYWAILLMYGSHDMRHRFPQVDGSKWDPRVLGCHKNEFLPLVKFSCRIVLS